MFRLVEHLCPRLGASGVSVIYGHLRQLPRQYEEMHVRLIRHFAEAASGSGSRGGGGGGAEKNAAPTGERGVMRRFVCRTRSEGMLQSKQPCWQCRRASTPTISGCRASNLRVCRAQRTTLQLLVSYQVHTAIVFAKLTGEVRRSFFSRRMIRP